MNFFKISPMFNQFSNYLNGNFGGGYNQSNGNGRNSIIPEELYNYIPRGNLGNVNGETYYGNYAAYNQQPQEEAPQMNDYTRDNVNGIQMRNVDGQMQVMPPNQPVLEMPQLNENGQLPNMEYLERSMQQPFVPPHPVQTEHPIEEAPAENVDYSKIRPANVGVFCTYQIKNAFNVEHSIPLDELYYKKGIAEYTHEDLIRRINKVYDRSIANYKIICSSNRFTKYINADSTEAPVFHFDFSANLKTNASKDKKEINLIDTKVDLEKAMNLKSPRDAYRVQYTEDGETLFALEHSIDDLNTAGVDKSRMSITGLFAPIASFGFSNVQVSFGSKKEIIDRESIPDSQTKRLMETVFYAYYYSVYESLYRDMNAACFADENLKELAYKLLYTTIKDSPCMNVNRLTDSQRVIGFPDFANFVSHGNMVDFVFLTQPRMMIRTQGASQKTSKTEFCHEAVVSYIKSNIVIMRVGKMRLANRMIVGPSKYVNKTGAASGNMEYKWCNIIQYIDDQCKIEIMVIPYRVNQSAECCYKYDVYASFYTLDNALISRLYGTEFFVVEECVSNFCHAIHDKNAPQDNAFRTEDHYTKIGIPAAFSADGMVVPPRTTLDFV